MFPLITRYKNILVSSISLILIIGLYFYIHSLKSQIRDLKSQLTQNQVELVNYKLENERYKNTLDTQNEQIKKLKTDREKALKKLTKWKALPPKIKYKTIIKIRKVKSNECQDIKKVINAIRNIDFNSL